MATNISKFIQLNDFLLLEYEFNRDGVTTAMSSPILAQTEAGFQQYFDNGGLGVSNNTFNLNSVATETTRGRWFVDTIDVSGYWDYFDSSAAIASSDYEHDTVKVHIVSGYNFDDISGFLLQVRALNTDSSLMDISNFTWLKQVNGDAVQKFASNTLYLSNKFYDKYVEFKVPSIGVLGGNSSAGIEADLSIQALSDVYLSYSTIPVTDNNQYLLEENINVNLPVTSVADSFNCLIAESTNGDYIEFYATWNDQIIGEYMSDIETGRIKLFTSNNPNDNYEEFTERYGVGAAKWSVLHELYVYEHIPGGSSLLTQKYVFTQEDTWNDPNLFRPVIKNADIASSYSVDYICRLTNRMDGTQIIRKATLASTDPAKYGIWFTRLNVDNVIPYNIFNRIEGEVSQSINIATNDQTKFVKIYYDTTTVTLDDTNTVFPQGTGPLFLKKGDSIYKFSFVRLNANTDPVQRENVDLSGVFDYELLFVKDDDSKIRVSPTYSSNMNTVLGEIEFKLMDDQIDTLLKQTNNTYQIRIKNPNGADYTFYEGLYFDYQNFTEVTAQYNELFDVTALQTQIAELEVANEALQTENDALKAT